MHMMYAYHFSMYSHLIPDIKVAGQGAGGKVEATDLQPYLGIIEWYCFPIWYIYHFFCDAWWKTCGSNIYIYIYIVSLYFYLYTTQVIPERFICSFEHQHVIHMDWAIHMAIHSHPKNWHIPLPCSRFSKHLHQDGTWMDNFLSIWVETVPHMECMERPVLQVK